MTKWSYRLKSVISSGGKSYLYVAYHHSEVVGRITVAGVLRNFEPQYEHKSVRSSRRQKEEMDRIRVSG